jgi:site-specific DNA recombinase
MDITALYIRLSREDMDLDNTKKESASIQNQRLHLQSFLMSHVDVKRGEIEEYVDDGYSGTNFERPAFQAMLDDIRNGQVKCIIVKDFSRLGRNYIEVGNYLEQIFPVLGVRFISVDDGYDSQNSNGDVPGLDVVFKNIIHDHYSKELSHKVVQVKRNLAKKGLFLAGIPPYGYLKDPQDKYHLVVDPESAKAVRHIFALALEGKGYSEIARILNRQEIESPARRLWRLGIRGHTKDTKQAEALRWRSEAVAQILQNEVVLGNVINHRVERKTIGKSSLKKVCKEDNIIVENMHEPIIDKNTFEQVQSLIGKKKVNNLNKKKQQMVHPLSGIMKCSYCGKNLILEKGWYRCRHSRYADDKGHRKVKIEEREILSAIGNIIYFVLKLHSEDMAERQKPIKEVNLVETDMSSVGEQKLKMLALYEEFSSGQINKDIFLEKKALFQLQVLKSKENAVQPGKRNACHLNDMLDVKMQLDDMSWITRELLNEMLRTVQVTNETEVKIVWKCEDWCNSWLK